MCVLEYVSRAVVGRGGGARCVCVLEYVYRVVVGRGGGVHGLFNWCAVWVRVGVCVCVCVRVCGYASVCTQFSPLSFSDKAF